MPHFFNNTLVVTKQELVPMWWSNYNTLKSELRRYKDKNYGIERVQLGGNGRQLLVAFDSLPKHVQNGIGDPRITKNALEKFYKVDADAVRFYNDFERPNYGYLKADEMERCIINASMLIALLKLEKARINERLTKGGSIRKTREVQSVPESLVNDAVAFQETLQDRYQVQHTLPTHPRRFRQALTDFQNNSYLSVVRDPTGKSFENAKKIDEATQKLLKYLFAGQKNKPSATEIARQYEAFLNGYLEITNSKTGEIHSPKGFKQLSLSSITNYLASWESKIGTWAKRNGDRQVLMQTFEPYHSLEQPTFSGSLISIDDRQPPFEYEKGKRMWFYIGLDLASMAYTTIVYGKSKEGIILEFYRQMIRNYHEWGLNLPDGLECESSLNSSFKNTFLQEGTMFQNVRIEANNARGKRVEREFGDLRKHEKEEIPGWRARPFAKAESNQAGPGGDMIIPYDELKQYCLRVLEIRNNSAHDTVKNKSRWEYFLENQNPDLKPTNYKALLPHLGEKTTTSCKAGIIRFRSGEWILGRDGSISTGEVLIDLMKKVEGKTIDIYWLDNNQGDVFVAHIYCNEQYICEAHAKPIYPRAKIERKPEHEAARDIMTRYVATIQGYQRTQKNELEPVYIEDNRPKVLNNKFKIPGLNKYEPQNLEEVEVFEDTEEELELIEVEPSSNPAGSSWMDAFKK